MSIVLNANLKTGKLNAFGKTIDVSCLVRNELNGQRKKNQVVKSMPEGKPIQPRQFPAGSWTVGMPVTRTDPYLAPWFIPTTAFQMLPIWSLDTKGQYKEATDKKTRDVGYGLHHSTSNTTQGCIKIIKMDDLLWLVTKIIDAIENKQTVTLIVV